MSSFPFRNLFRSSHAGAEKIAIACAAFGLMQAGAQAGEMQSQAVSIDDPWINHAAPQQTAGADAWGNPRALNASLDDEWGTTLADRTARQAARAPAVQAAPAPSAASAGQDHAGAPNTLVMDTAGWNDKPRGRSPGLIASNNAWRNRPETVAVPAVRTGQANAPATPRPPVVDVVKREPVAVVRPTISNNAWAPPAKVEQAKPFDVSSHWNFSRTRYAWTPRIRGGMRFNGAGMPVDADVKPVDTAFTSAHLSGTSGSQTDAWR